MHRQHNLSPANHGPSSAPRRDPQLNLQTELQSEPHREPQPDQLLARLPSEWLPLCWTAERAALERLVQEHSSQAAADPLQQGERCLLLALALWLAGESDRGDDLLLDLDAQQPQLGLIPDRWQLWPGATIPEPLSALLEAYLHWRHDGVPAALPLWRQRVGEAVAADPGAQWRRLLEPQALALLALVLASDAAGDQLRGELEPQLVAAMGEAVVAQHPQEALLFWSGISRRCPSWDYARLKTADLSLQSGQLQRSAAALAAATPDQRRNPWLHDIAARLAMAQADPARALRYWEEAISAAAGDAEMIELMRQRRREAEWQLELAEVPQGSPGPSGEADLDRFAAWLEQLAQRFAVTLPHQLAADVVQAEPDPEAFAAFLDQASGRLALAG